MHTLRYYLNGKWSEIQCYIKTGKYYQTGTDKELDVRKMHWVYDLTQY